MIQLRPYQTQAIAELRTALAQPHTAETKAKMSAARKGQPFTAEHCANLSAANMGNKNRLGTGSKSLTLNQLNLW